MFMYVYTFIYIQTHISNYIYVMSILMLIPRLSFYSYCIHNVLEVYDTITMAVLIRNMRPDCC